MYLFLTLALVGWAVSMVLASLVIRGEKRARMSLQRELERANEGHTETSKTTADEWQRAQEELEVEQHYQDWKARNET